MKILFENKGQAYQAEAQIIKGNLWVHFQGRTFIYESDAQKKKSRKHLAIGTGHLLSPMPGKITKILKNLNDAVIIGEAILVMEAMKMEYTLKADIKGVLTSIDCAVGDQVPLGKKIAHIQADKSL